MRFLHDLFALIIRKREKQIEIFRLKSKKALFTSTGYWKAGKCISQGSDNSSVLSTFFNENTAPTSLIDGCID